MSILALEEPKKIDLTFAGRCEVGMAALRGEGPVGGAVPEKSGFAETGAGGDDGTIAGGLRRAGLQHRDLVGAQDVEAVAHRLEIVEQHELVETRSGRDRRRRASRAG